MNKGCLLTLILLIALVALLMYRLPSGFGPEYDNAVIKQTIGGTLICNSVYDADHHSWEYEVSYKYKPDNNSIIDIGNGTYYNREWQKDEQLVQYKNWIILKTGGGISTDKIIVGDLKTKKFTEYQFRPEEIEKDSIWQVLKIKSFLNDCCPETFIDEITTGQIVLHYKFRASEKQLDKYEQRKIYYTINELNGQSTMTGIE